MTKPYERAKPRRTKPIKRVQSKTDNKLRRMASGWPQVCQSAPLASPGVSAPSNDPSGPRDEAKTPGKRGAQDWDRQNPRKRDERPKRQLRLMLPFISKDREEELGPSIRT